MEESFKKIIPWQDRERIGGVKAFVMTLLETLLNPVDYFEKLKVRDDFQEPLSLSFYNSLFLAGPLILQILFWVPFLAVIFILAVTPLVIFVLAFLIQRILRLFGEEAGLKDILYVLAFSSPVFIFACVPQVGYWLAAGALVVLAGIGLATVLKIDILKAFFALILVPLIIFIPYSAVNFSKNWQASHPQVNAEIEAQKVLAALSIAAENYALKNSGSYPASSEVLVQEPARYLAKDYCGQEINHYQIICDFRSFGYFLKAEPQGWEGRGKKTFYVTTGGKLREQ